MMPLRNHNHPAVIRLNVVRSVVPDKMTKRRIANFPLAAEGNDPLRRRDR
jgi:hypothetical protein